MTLTTAFLIAQFLLLGIVLIGIALLRAGERRFSSVTRPRPVSWNFLLPYAVFALISMACLIFSRDILSASKPVFPGIDIDGWSRETAFQIEFILDLIGSAFLIRVSGGSQLSPFSPILFLLPTIAILLREPPKRFVFYAVVAAMLFLIAYPAKWRDDYVSDNINSRLSFSFVSLGCLALATIVGYVTRPT